MPTIELMDTTLRDGAQGEGVDYSLQDKLSVARVLDELGVPFIEGGNPYSNPKDAELFAIEKSQLGLHQAKLVPFGATCRPMTKPQDDAGLKALLDADTEYVSLFGKCSLFHVDTVLRVSPEENLSMIAKSIQHLAANGRKVFFACEHFFDGCEADMAYSFSVVRAALEAGARTITLCDTNGGTLPTVIGQRVKALKEAFAQAQIGIHCHNDSGLALAGTLAAIQNGATHAQGTIGGVGERCGNTDLCQLIPTLEYKLGLAALPKDKLPLLSGAYRRIFETLNLPTNPRAPYVGYSAFAHKGGMHIDAVNKDPKTFEHIDPSGVGNRRRLLNSEQTGRSGVHERLKRLLPELTRDDPRVSKVLDRLKRREKRGYAYESADGSFELMALDTLGMRKRYFEVVDFHVLSSMDAPQESSAQAYIKIAVDGREEINAAEGEGPVNALDMALRKALTVFYPSLSHMHLRDFKVRVVDSGGTASVVRVLIESTDGNQVWTTIGVSPNIIRACFKALVDSVEYYLCFIDEKQRTSQIF